MTSISINYVENYFEHPTLKQIHGQPSHHSLKLLKDQIKANLASVTSDLGGEVHDHMGLGLLAQEYTIISGIPYIRPIHPGVLNVPPRTMAHESKRLREEHKATTKTVSRGH